ncbi:hypothetical protein G3A39_41240, partial [Paraburkholderia aspalathi]|nr:hypothetical protein [Paraburkholderia aspalathi]
TEAPTIPEPVLAVVDSDNNVIDPAVGIAAFEEQQKLDTEAHYAAKAEAEEYRQAVREEGLIQHNDDGETVVPAAKNEPAAVVEVVEVQKAKIPAVSPSVPEPEPEAAGLIIADDF